MIDFYRVLELDKLLHSFCDDKIVVFELIDGLLSGKSNSAEWKMSYKAFCGNKKMIGAALITENSDDDMLLNQILTACDPDMLDSLITKYGTKSRLGKLIASYCESVEHIEIEQGLKKQQISFYQILVEQMEKKGYKTDADYYKTLCFSRQTFSRLRNPNYNLSRENALWLTLGLTPDYLDGIKMLNAAGFSLRKNDRREYIIIYVMKNGSYTLQELNELLVYFGESPIGCEL